MIFGGGCDKLIPVENKQNNLEDREMLEPAIIDSYIEVLESELLLATGCTEPIALAYCAATLRKVLKPL